MRIWRGAPRPLLRRLLAPPPPRHPSRARPYSSWWVVRAIASANGTDPSADPLHPRGPAMDGETDRDHAPRSRADVMAETLLRGPPPKIHVLGTGNIGCLIAHSLRGLHPKPPVTLLVHRRAMLDDFEAMGRVINVEMERLNVSRRGFEIELSNKHIEGLLPGRQHRTHKDSSPHPGHIEHLIVTTKMHQTRVALEPLIARLGPTSTIAFIQNGMGIIDEINTNFFPNPATRPNYIVGVTTHGVSAPRDPYQPFTVLRNGIGTLQLGIPTPTSSTPVTANTDPRTTPPLSSLPPSTSYLLETLTAAPNLVGTYVSPQDLLTTQLEKLAVNSIINPLTTIFAIPNGQLLHNFAASKVMKLLLWETSQVICALPQLQHLPNLETRFSAENLYAAVVRVARGTEGNTSSMLQDVRIGRTTEVDYINGYLVRMGLELGVPCTMNYMVQCMVKAREKMARLDKEAEVPFEGIEV
ncbi:ketopantoate reductase PanE/ApbA C terminal-domain-containing protein [Peziza echinospora]|nr:ketopantoate reductase PanE/ApbA C terminal-domain-containing protein [Peziza echinospora]